VVGDRPRHVEHQRWIDHRRVGLDVFAEVDQVDIDIAANHLLGLRIVDRHHYLALERAIVVQQRHALIGAIRQRLAVQLVALQNVDRVLHVDTRQLVATHFARSEEALDRLDLHQQIRVRRIATNRFYRHRAVMQVVRAVRCRRQGVGQFGAVRQTVVLVHRRQEVAARRIGEHVTRRENRIFRRRNVEPRCRQIRICRYPDVGVHRRQRLCLWMLGHDAG